MKKLVFGLILLFCGQLFAADLFDNTKPRDFKLADPLELNATIGGFPIWNGEGKWRLYNLARRDSTGTGQAIPIGDVGLFQTENKKFVAVMWISATLGQGGSTRWLGEPCKRDDMLYKANIGKSVWEDNCVTINHISNYGNNPGGKDAELYALFVEQGISPPPTILQIKFTRNGTRGNFLNITLSVNPEVMGFARETEVAWGKNPWNKTMSFKDPAKKQFIDALGVWSLQFAKQMDAALDQKTDAFAAIPTWRSVLSDMPKPEPIKSTVSLD
ncbi:MAG: hypothetical protein IPN06_18225 [Burkholderiales bacterium]|nr:hypothetical protein [Burkholderiales bacterium]